ncbi:MULTISPECIES: DUF6313 family protein [Streptomyces]|uniref:Uncharacterized protein n=1 Tax=Streptomyces albus (strain ATCC 21838 / DSM 41398 / FERM P-419 / JCM 4703 / NBRC 107858) TaxID=1081613 RepID=A0A0B5F162_STRA4|nr:DUF6313 family protein [Streptomyces sp. SCSIO ZS0520]AJE84626.1 hypothetical protein SLNWT_4250 [Streptomyces albus]AOU78934.1 hypothetical protein SLNHY_4243 [Streptomyces albus]
MSSGLPSPLPPALTPPGRAPRGTGVRRAFRSRKALSGLTQWVIDWGVLILVVVAAVWVAAGFAWGWAPAYRVFTLIESPVHGLPWAASVIGWLLVPAIIGGVAGHVIATRIRSVKEISPNNLFKKRTWADRRRLPSLITKLGALFHKSEQQQFLDAYVRIAHRGDWPEAQDHWEIVVRDALCTAEFADLDRTEALRLAESLCRELAWLLALSGRCLVCEARHTPPATTP